MELCRNYAIPLCIIDSNRYVELCAVQQLHNTLFIHIRLLSLSMEYELGIKSDLLAIMINRKEVQEILSLSVSVASRPLRWSCAAAHDHYNLLYAVHIIIIGTALQGPRWQACCCHQNKGNLSHVQGKEKVLALSSQEVGSR